MNLTAKIEKHNKVAGVIAFTMADAYREARVPEYVTPCKRRELEEANVAGLAYSLSD